MIMTEDKKNNEVRFFSGEGLPKANGDQWKKRSGE
jgi:hypothetical protein